MLGRLRAGYHALPVSNWQSGGATTVLVRTYPNCNGAARAMSGASGRAHESAFGKLLGPLRVGCRRCRTDKTPRVRSESRRAADRDERALHSSLPLPSTSHLEPLCI